MKETDSKILVSECLTGIPCRMDGKAKLIEEIKELAVRGKAIPVCPEVLGGLSTPRDPSEIRGDRVFSKSSKDVTDAFRRGSKEAFRICKENGCTLAILKSKSPACGYGWIHDGTFSNGMIKGNGVFAQMLVDAGIPVMTEKEYLEGLRKDMEIIFRIAEEKEASVIADLRQRIWDSTYRGIYSDKEIDCYDYKKHEIKDLERINDQTYAVYLIQNRLSGEDIGYFYFQDNGKVHIQSLYLLPEYQHKGIGCTAFDLVKKYCCEHDYTAFTCNCNLHNTKARSFYEHMGGRITAIDSGHTNRKQDQVTYTFTV